MVSLGVQAYFCSSFSKVLQEGSAALSVVCLLFFFSRNVNAILVSKLHSFTLSCVQERIPIPSGIAERQAD